MNMAVPAATLMKNPATRFAKKQKQKVKALLYKMVLFDCR